MDLEPSYLLMTPGPVQIPEDVLQVLAEPMIHHRTPEFEKILRSVLERLPQLFETKERVYIQAATGSGGMESAIVNTLSPGETVLCVVAGKFGERWREMCRAYSINVISYDVPWGEAADPLRIVQILSENPSLKAVLIQACETSTGILNPIEEIAMIVRAYPETLFMVDAITACGVIPLRMDEWGLDVVVAASQKALMLPTGLALLAFSKKAWRAVEKAKCPRVYWDIRKEHTANLKDQTHFSSAVSLIKGLDLVLDRILKDGLASNIQRTRRFADALRAGATALGLKLYGKSPSPSVTAFLVPNGAEGEHIQAHLEKKYRITITGGQDQLKGKVIRIGTMGALHEDDIMRTIHSLGCTLRDLQIGGASCDPELAVDLCAQKLKGAT